jgi:hypothetical protein
MKRSLLASLAIILLSFTAQAKVFRNAYISFEMPETWKCNLEQTEWVCRSEQTKEAKEAIIIRHLSPVRNAFKCADLSYQPRRRGERV